MIDAIRQKHILIGKGTETPKRQVKTGESGEKAPNKCHLGLGETAQHRDPLSFEFLRDSQRRFTRRDGIKILEETHGCKISEDANGRYHVARLRDRKEQIQTGGSRDVLSVYSG